MNLNFYTKDDVVVLVPEGKIVPGMDESVLDGKLYSLLGKGHKKVIIDLSKTAWISSSTISILLHHHSKFKGINGYLKLASLPKKIQEIIALSKLDVIFEIYGSLESAFHSFKR